MHQAPQRPAALAILLAAVVSGCAPRVALETAPSVRATGWHPHVAAAAPAATLPPRHDQVGLGSALGSAELDALIGRATAANSDIEIANARVRQARALLGIARNAMLPVVSGSAGIAGTRTERSSGDPFDFSDAFAGLDVAFDLDLFGLARAERRAAAQRLRAADHDREATLIAVQSDVARAYVQRATLARRTALLQRNIEQARALERVIRLRVEAGETSRVDLGLQRIQLRELEADLLRLAEALDRTRTSLAVLLGEESPGFDLEPAPLDALLVPEIAPIAPAALVHRPDIRAAEARIAAAGGDVDAARAAFYPRLRLTGSALGQAASLSGPLSSTFSIGADLLAPIFNRGRLSGNLELAAARQGESVAVYRQTLLGALMEVENALSAVARARERAELLDQIVAEARLTARLARLQFMEGEADLQQLFDAEQRLVQAEDAHAIALQERLEAAVDLFKAMGGRSA